MSFKSQIPIASDQDHEESNALFLAGRPLAVIFIITVISYTVFYALAPRLLRKFTRNLNVGKVGLLNLQDIKWKTHHVPIKDGKFSYKSDSTAPEDASDLNESLSLTISSVGLRFGSNEGTRRQWIALRVDSPHIRLPARYLQSRSPDPPTYDSESEVSSFDPRYRDRHVHDASGFDSTFQTSSASHQSINFFQDISSLFIHARVSLIRRLPPRFLLALRFLRKLWRIARLKIVRPLLNKFNRFGRRLSWIISVFGLEVNDIAIEVNGICKVKCGIKIGLQMSRGDQGELCCWVIIKKLEINQLLTDETTQHVKEDAHPQDRNCDGRTAFHFPGCMEISASAGLDPVIGLASVVAGSKPMEYVQGMRSSLHPSPPSPVRSWKHYIRPRSVVVTLEVFKEMPAARSPLKKGNPSPYPRGTSTFISIPNLMSILRVIPSRTRTDVKKPTINKESMFSSPEGPARSSNNSFSALSIIRQFQISVLSLHCRYILAGDVSSIAPRDNTSTRQRKTMAIDLDISKLVMNLDLSAKKTGKESSESSSKSTTHLEWFGRGAPIPLRFDSQWKDVVVNATLLPESPGSSETHRHGFTQLLRISEFSCILSSSWLPRTLRERIHFDYCPFAAMYNTRLQIDPNDNMMVAEFEIGKIRGQMPIENLLILHSLSHAHASAHHNSNDDTKTHSPSNKRREDVPKLVFGLSIHSVQYDLHAPTNMRTSSLHQVPSNAFNPSYSHLPSSADIMSISCSSINFNLTGEYADLTVKRSEAARRAAKIKARRNEVYVPISLRGVKVSSAHEESILLERRNVDTESDKRPLDYSEDIYRVSTERDVGPHHAAYPLPTPSSSLPQSKPRVDILREMSSVDFSYQLAFTLQIHSINALFQDERKIETSRPTFASFEAPTRVLSSRPYDFFTLKSVEVSSEFSFAGRNLYHSSRKLAVPTIDPQFREGSVQTVIEDISFDLWRPNLLASLVIFSQTVTGFRRKSHPSGPHEDSNELSQATPRTIPVPRDVAFSIAVTQLKFLTGGFDSRADSRRPRGIKLVISNLLLECFRQSSVQPALYSLVNRARLDLKEDIRVQSNTHLMHNPEYDNCLIKCSLNHIEIFPIPDLNGSLRSDRFYRDESATNLPTFHSSSPTLWGDKPQNPTYPQSIAESALDDSEESVCDNESVSIIEIKRFACRTTFQILKKAEIGPNKLILAVETNAITFHINTFHIYCAMLSISTLLNLFKNITSHQTERVNHGATRRNELSVGIRAEVSKADFHVFLSPDVPICIEMRRISCRQSSKLGLDVRCDNFLLAGRSATSSGLWDDLLKIKTCQIQVLHSNSSKSPSGPTNRGWHPFIVTIEGDAARLRIPFKFVIAEVLENMSLLVKTTKQLIHQFIRGGSGTASEPQVEAPKKLPEIRIRFRIICVLAEDDPFENKLNAIRRAGKEEVKDRLERDESFQQKVRAMKEAAKKNPEARHSWESRRHSDWSSNDSCGHNDSASFDSAYLKKHSPHSHVPITQAIQRLDEYNAVAWVKRIRNALAEQERQEDAFQRQLYGHTTTKSTDMPVPMVSVKKATPLVRVVFNSIRIALYKADFEQNENGLMDYLHRVGKGLPKDTKFSLVVPMHISWQMEGATIRLRDFPIYLFSLSRPQAQNGRQQERDLTQYTWQFESDFVIAEEMCGVESIRTVQSVVIPSHHSTNGNAYTLEIPKSVMPVKTYADPFVKLKSTAPVQLGWGNSMQPAVQDMMRVLESVTKPPVDLSERVGFWDKVRLSLHWKVDISCMGSKSDVVLHLKGSRDPYELIGSGAGFVKVWRGNVKMLLGHNNDEQEFLQIKSDQYILGIPNLKDLINNAATGSAPVATATPAASYKRVYQHLSQVSDSDESDTEALTSRETEFIKILGKLTNGVRWGMGIVLERACSDNSNKTCTCQGPAFHRKCRIFTFKPHYEVITRTPQFGHSPDGNAIDSYQDFRSDFIHFSISLTSPTEVGNRQKRPTGQNSLYFSAESFTHFWCWLKTFDSALALPIRQGNLFPSAQAPSKKFGRHVATIKYRFGISPLFLAHTYRYESPSDWVSGKNVVIGFKAKISRFNVDLHSRAVETTMRKPEMKEPKKLIRKAFYQAEVECQDVEIKALSAVFQTPRKSTYANGIGLTADQDELETNSMWEEQMEDDSEFILNPTGDEGAFPIYSGKLRAKDAQWNDPNDFSDIFFWPNSSTVQQPKIKMFDCLACPRITFLRRPSSSASHQSTSGSNSFSDAESIFDAQLIEKTKFGKEDTHTCFIGKAEDPMKVQVGLIDARLKELDEQKFRAHLKAAAYNPPRPEDTSILMQIQARIQTLQALRESMHNAKCASKRHSQPEGTAHSNSNLTPEYSTNGTNGERYLLEMANQLADENSEWSSRLLVHNPSILISNSVRDILLKYYYSYEQRRAFIYHLSARAVKFILDLADQESSISPNKNKNDSNRRKSRVRSFDYQKFEGRPTSTSSMGAKSMPQLPEDSCPDSSFRSYIEEEVEQDIPEDFLIDAANLILLVRPQIAFRSEVDDISTVVLTAFHAQFKSFEILDPSHLDDPVNATVMKRNFGMIKGFQMFYPCNTSALSSLRSTLENQQCHVPLEVLVDLRLEPWGFDRLIGRCTVNIAHDAFNQLRIKRRSAGADWSFSSATQPHLQTSTDLLRVEMADSVSVHATATHYRAIYNVITDLCLYTDPAQKKRNAALETMQFAYDVDDLAGMAEQIQQQQALIRLCRTKLDQEYVDMNLFDEIRMMELTQCEYQLWMYASDLNLMVEAIRRSQANRLGRSKAEKLPGSQLQTNAKSITWYMLADSSEAIAKLSITGTRFESYTLPDTSVSNRLYVQDMLALNISADNDRQFDEILSRYEPYNPLGAVANPKQFLTVLWKTLPPIAGISIIESFLLEIHPIRVQIEHAIGVKVHDYLFASKAAASEDDNDSDEQTNSFETLTSTFPISEEDHTKKLHHKRSIIMNLYQSKTRPPTPDVTDRRPKLSVARAPSRESLVDLPPAGRSRVGDTFGLLNADWRSNSQVGSSHSIFSNRVSRAASVRSNSSDGRRHGVATSAAPNVLLNWNKQKTEDATEMKKRAQLYKSFLFIDVAPTILCVSYSGPKYPDIFDLVVKVPPFHFESRTWSYSEFFDEIRRTCVSSLFKQSPSILGQIITTARKNKSVPKLVGQKMASGFKFKKRNLFERGHSTPFSHSRSATSASGTSTISYYSSTNTAGTTTDYGRSPTFPEGTLPPNLHSLHSDPYAFEPLDVPHSSDAKESTPRPSDRNPSTPGNMDPNSYKSLDDQSKMEQVQLHVMPRPENPLNPLNQRTRSQKKGLSLHRGHRQSHKRTSTLDAHENSRLASSHQRRQSEGPPTSWQRFTPTTDPLPSNSIFFAHSSGSRA